MGHIAHLRKRFKSINMYDYIITLIKRRKNIINFMRIYKIFIWRNLKQFNPRMPWARFGWNWSSGSGEEDKKVKSLQTDGQTDRQTDKQTDRRRTTGDQKSSLELSSGESVWGVSFLQIFTKCRGSRNWSTKDANFYSMSDPTNGKF